jgi:hypothetical protein
MSAPLLNLTFTPFPFTLLKNLVHLSPASVNTVAPLDQSAPSNYFLPFGKIGAHPFTP